MDQTAVTQPTGESVTQIHPSSPNERPKPPPPKLPDMSEYPVKTFYPTLKEFKNLTKYISSLEAEGVHKTGICKIVPPKEWIPRREGYRLEDFDFQIDKPLKQTLTPEPGQNGVFRFSSQRLNTISVPDYAKLAQVPQYLTPNHQTYEELEAKYWETTKAAQFLDPIYGADVNESLTDLDCEIWNVSKLDSILKEGVTNQADIIPGINNSYLYFGMWAATFSWHVEDMDLYATNYLHYGAPKTWYCIPPEHGYKMELLANQLFPDWHRICKNFVRHKICMIHPDILRRHGIPVNKVVQEERNFIVVFPHAYHSGFNHGFNIAEAANFALPRWVEYGKRYRACCCAQNISAVDGQRLSLHPFISKYQPDRYDSWKEGRDFGPHPEDPPEIKELYQNINLQNPNEEEEKIVQRLAVVLDHPLLETHQPQPIPDFKEVITLNPEVKDTDWGPSFVEEEFNTKRCDIKLSLFHPPTDQVEKLIEAQKAREQEEDKENIKDKKSRKFGFFGFSEAELQARMSMTKCYSRKKHKLRACKKCPGCQTPDCQECVFCKDLTKYGGPNKLRQKCKERICNNPTPVTCDKCTWNIDAITKSGPSSAKKSPAKSKKSPKQKKSTGGGRPKKSAIVAAATTTDSDSSCYSPVVRTRKSARALSDTDLENSPAAATRIHKRAAAASLGGIGEIYSPLRSNISSMSETDDDMKRSPGRPKKSKLLRDGDFESSPDVTKKPRVGRPNRNSGNEM